MAPPGGITGTEDLSAKHLLDSIGEEVYNRFHTAALDRSGSDLQGRLSEARFENEPKDKQTENDPCKLLHQYHTNVTVGYDKENPCKNRSDVRFSDTQGAECDNNKIRGSDKKNNSVGACAPFRRLHLCDQHLEHIKHDRITRHSLLADVCLAAKFEGETLTTQHGQHQQTNPGFHTNICTVLARSFADIGDIIRGRDLFYGNPQEKEQRKQLEKNLKTIFEKIHEDVTKKGAKDHYKGDTPDYYQLREDWWALNRKDVWTAITCGHPGGTYFRQTACSRYYPTGDKCRCAANLYPPTYFDYVPQYLRWFEEWAEDFCRKKKKYVDIVKTNCRDYSRNLYCSGNGLDCKETIRVIGHHVIGSECSKCSVWCRRYKKWIDNQKEEFLKQKKKCENEISGNGRQRQRRSTTSNYKGYEKKFYDIFKTKGGVDKFLQLLNEERECKEFSNDLGKIDFKNVHGGTSGDGGAASDSNNSNKTFSHSQYCEECPGCGVELIGNEWTEKSGGTCTREKRYNIPEDTQYNVIPFLSFGDEHKEIIKKIEQFCGKSNSDSSELTEKWKCYYGNQNVEICTLENRNKSEEEPKEIQKTFPDFFYFWIRHLLNDSIEWRDKINNCIEKAKEGKCNSGCNKDCDCFKEWIDKKEKEWDKIKDHFKTQKGFELFKYDYDLVLKHVLNIDELFKDITEAYGNSQEIQGIKDTLAKKRTQNADDATEQKNTIDLLFEYDSEEAQKCKKTQEECEEKKKQQEVTRLRSAVNPDDSPQQPAPNHDNDSDEEIEEEEEEEKKEETETEEPKKDEICENGSVNCNKHEAYSTSKCKTKTNLIGLEAYYRWGGRDYPNIYVSPRVQQLCLEPLQLLAKSNAGATDESKLIEAFKKCAYNEGKGLYEYYNNNKSTIGKNDSPLSDEEVKTYTLEAMKRSYADYGNIMKGDFIWDYEDKEKIDLKIIDFATNHNKSTRTSSVSTSDDVKRRKLWESIRAHVWKAMICGYENVGGSFDNEDLKCKLPDTENTDQFFRWFVEWVENFCIRREQELKRLKGKCEKGICNGTDETKKKECKMLCESYKQFLSNSKTQYENQKKEYEIIKSSFNEYKKKDAFTFLKDKCNLKCLCFEDKSGTYFDDLLKNLPDDVKDECDCKTSKVPDDKVNDLDKCPNNINNNKNICNTYKKRRMCTYSNNRNSLEYWYGKDMLIPPRRRKIRLRNITGSYFYKKQDGKNKFKDDLLSAAASEAKFLFKNYEDKNEALQAIKYTFADIGDIIKGKDMMDDMVFKDIRRKLEKVLETTGKDPETPEKWWEQNRKDVWKAMLCGYKMAGGEIKPNDCNIPTEENTHQFLRWLKEWGTQYCKEKQQLKSNMQMPCKSHFDKYGIIEKKNDINPNCLPSLDKYEVWSNNRLPEWDGLSKKFTKDKEKDKYNNVQENSAASYLKQNCSECKCSFKDIEQTHDKSKNGGYDIYVDILDKAQIPGFVEDIAYRYKGINPKCPEDNECDQYRNIRCKLLPHDDNRDWESTFVKNNNAINKGVLLPPRRIHLCLRIDAEQIDHLRSEIENIKNFICSSAFSEAKRLKKVYKDDNDKLLQAIKYSFSDIGSIVKGEDMKEGTASDNIAKIFGGKKFSETNRKKWWNENKYHVWESMLCGYKQAGGDTKTNENCRFPDIERVPQFLRWFQEWAEIFCVKRNELYENMVNACQKAECDKSTGNVQGSDCIEACEKYKYYVLKKKKEYYIQKDKYDNQFKKVLNNKDAEEFLNVHCLSQYFSEEKKQNWDNPYESFNEATYKDKCDCQKTEKPIITPAKSPKKPEVPPPYQPLPPPLPADEPFNRDILEKTIPFGIALALGSIAFLFLKKKMKKKKKRKKEYKKKIYYNNKKRDFNNNKN
ncbi:hypothetical protein PFMALIP_06262 [Plasmodium falciparum MaliPS096_E11]|uniref:Erythrocyte membrane protein 1 n=1 Tax=Plasmodium falciparum MaliPS096_E11 TaxID=1036727 RepID=A0A024WFN9_PLAFA|nr:hypothetical protein PFMALIP_06262 [Plasmodium falciparum MaliPS096_E11]